MRSRIVIYIVRSSIFCATARISTSGHHKPGRKGVTVAVPCVSSILAKIDVRACAKAKKRRLTFPLMDILRELSSGSFAGACTLRASSYSFYSRTAMPPSSHDFDPDNGSGAAMGGPSPPPGLPVVAPPVICIAGPLGSCGICPWPETLNAISSPGGCS